MEIEQTVHAMLRLGEQWEVGLLEGVLARRIPRRFQAAHRIDGLSRVGDDVELVARLWGLKRDVDRARWG